MLRGILKLYNFTKSHRLNPFRNNDRIASSKSTSKSIVNATTIDSMKMKAFSTCTMPPGKTIKLTDYQKSMHDLSMLQSNRRILSKDAGYMFELFKKQLALSGLKHQDLDKLKVIHVTGTKGKGSTCAFVESILRTAGLKTGLYSSPHLIDVNERIKINGRPISKTKFCEFFRPMYLNLTMETGKNNLPMPGYFAFLTILAFDIFIKEEVDCLVLEVGIGGEFDSTNVIDNPVVCGISTLDYDHTNILGDTIEQIAWTKSGIVKKGVPLFTVEQPDAPEAVQVISRRCSERSSSMHVCSALDKNSIKLGIQGDAQYVNAALACQLASYFLYNRSPSSLSLDSHSVGQVHTNLNELPSFFSEALANCSLPGRCQILRDALKTFFIDGAHTRKSMENSLKWFKSYSEGSSKQLVRVLILNIIGERDKMSIIKPLVEYGKFDQVIFTPNRLKPDRSHEDKNLKVMNSHAFGETVDSANLNLKAWKSLELNMNEAPKTKCSVATSVSESLKLIGDMMSIEANEKEAHILVTGSLALAGSVLKLISK